MHGKGFVGLACLGSALIQGDLAAQIRVDANIATGLDISDSIGHHEEWLERVGTARGLASRAFGDAIQSGSHGLVGIAIFGWSSHGCPPLVGWVVVGNAEDAVRVAQELEARPLIDFDRAAGRRHQDQSAGEDRLTDVTLAIECGRRLLADAPLPADRSVLNIVGDGVDNVGEEPDAARDRAVAAGITVNSVVVNGDPGVVDYYRNHVIGGKGAFVMDIADAAMVTDVMTAKFSRDIASAAWP